MRRPLDPEPAIPEPEEERQALIQALNEARAELRATSEAARAALAYSGEASRTGEIRTLTQTVSVAATRLAEVVTALTSSHRDRAWIEVSLRELRLAFTSHRQAQPSQNPGASHHLLLFYAAECGLKALYLLNTGRERLDPDQDPELIRDGHDLGRWCRKAKVPAAMSLTTTWFRLKKTQEQQYPIRRAHEVWRYGPVMQR
ncbi:MAG: hypothetical protein FJX77_12045, partial [Armatimonadetes bacterium]|nr:hypothetical protein [Armatimonadota bacterium]